MWDEEPTPPPKRINRVALDPMGVAELSDYINELRVEIARVEAAIVTKQDHRGVANSFFQT